MAKPQIRVAAAHCSNQMEMGCMQMQTIPNIYIYILYLYMYIEINIYIYIYLIYVYIYNIPGASNDT